LDKKGKGRSLRTVWGEAVGNEAKKHSAGKFPRGRGHKERKEEEITGGTRGP